MKNNIKNFIGLLIIAGFGLYFYSMNSKVEGIRSLCGMYSEGQAAENFEENARKHSVRYMGSFELKNDPGTMQATFCAHLTACDTSCMLEYKDNKITKRILRK